MNILVLYECSNVVRDAFRARGHDAYSCDLADGADYREDALTLLKRCPPGELDVIIAHPPCTFLSVSGIHWNSRRPERAALTREALKHVAQLTRGLTAAKPRIGWCIENPVSILSTHWRKPDQCLQPWQFGHDASKKTCLWLHGLEPLCIDPALAVSPRYVCSACGHVSRNGPCWECCGEGRPRERWANQTDSGQNRLGPSATRAQERATTYPGIAAAMADQWGNE